MGPFIDFFKYVIAFVHDEFMKSKIENNKLDKYNVDTFYGFFIENISFHNILE